MGGALVGPGQLRIREQSSSATWRFLARPIGTDLLEAKASTGPLAVRMFTGMEIWTCSWADGCSGTVSQSGRTRGFYRNTGGHLQLDEENSRVLEKWGLVNGAVWSDLDGDGFPELILACEWGTDSRVSKTKAGHLHEITKELGLDRYTGWWRGVTTGRPLMAMAVRTSFSGNWG